MCAPFSIHDDDLIDAEAAAALDAVFAAERKRLALALSVASGATRYAFPRHDADAAIAGTVGAVTAARYTLDRLLISRVMGQRCVLTPSAQLQQIEMQARVGRNEAASGVVAFGPAIIAARRVDEAEVDASLILMAHARGAAIVAMADKVLLVEAAE